MALIATRYLNQLEIMNELELLKTNVRMLSTVHFGVNLCENLLTKVFKDIIEDDSPLYDLSGREGALESKFARVNKTLIIDENETIYDRLISAPLPSFCDLNRYKKDSVHISWQGIKIKYFKELCCGAFFNDCILIFRITKKQMIEDKEINFDNQHRDNEGSFQIQLSSKRKLKHWMDNYLEKTILWEDLMNYYK